MNKSSMIDLAKKYVVHIILFVMAIVIYLSITSYDLTGWDDCLYFSGAVNILQNHIYYPAYYPMGYSLLIVPFFYLFGISAQSAGYPCAILGALTVVILYEFTKDLLDRRAALFASLFLIFSYHLYASTLILSDVPALFFILLSIFAAVKYVKSEKVAFIYLFYFAAGFACSIRYTSALMFVIIGLYIILSNKIHLLKRREVWIGTLVFLVIISPQLISNHIHFGSVFRTGYSLESGQMLSLKYAFTSGPRRPQFQIITYIKYLMAGFGSPILPFYLYGMWDMIKQRNREKLSLIIPWIVVPLVFYQFYASPNPGLRYMFPVLPALLILSGHGFSKMCDKLGIEAGSNKVKPNKTGLSDFKTIKIVLIVLLVVILLIPTAMFWFNTIQEKEARVACQKNTFIWIHDNSNDDDIILSHGPVPAFKYYSQREVYSLQTSHDELDKLISSHNNTYLVIRDVWRSQRRYMLDIDTAQWLNETYGLIHLKTFESEPRLSLTSKLSHNLKSKAGSPSPATDRFDVYLIVK